MIEFDGFHCLQMRLNILLYLASSTNHLLQCLLCVYDNHIITLQLWWMKFWTEDQHFKINIKAVTKGCASPLEKQTDEESNEQTHSYVSPHPDIYISYIILFPLSDPPLLLLFLSIFSQGLFLAGDFLSKTFDSVKCFPRNEILMLS